MNDVEIKETKPELVKVIESNELDGTKSQLIINAFNKLLTDAQTYEKEALVIKVTDVSDIEGMAKARKARLNLKEIRTTAENKRKELKEQSLREGKAIDAVANIIKALIVPIEEYLEKQEKFAEIEETKKRIEKLNGRIAELTPFVVDTGIYNLGDMTDEAFSQLLEGAKKSYKDKHDALKKEEEDRIKREKEEKIEQERIRKENEDLKKEKEAREKREKELKAESDEKLRLEKEAREKAEKELADKKADDDRKAKEEKDRQEKEKQDKLQKEHDALVAPEKDKLFQWSERIKSVESPKDLSVEGMKIVREAEMQLLLIAQSIKEGIKKL